MKQITQNNNIDDDMIDDDMADFIEELENLVSGEDFFLPF